MRKRLFSGIQPTGRIHLGNYLGAVKSWVRLQEDYDAIFSVVDYHAMTIEYDPAGLRDAVLETAAVLMACGLEKGKCRLFVQSSVPLHTELSWILSTVTPLGHLERMTQFKDKSGQHSNNINLGLLSYPVLQAADIILYKAEKVPVGEDQVQHIELCRELSRKFNNRYSEVFPDAEEIIGKDARIMSLTDPSKKMSKTMPEGCIFLTDSDEETASKIKTAVTDPGRMRRKDPGNPEICNIYSLHGSFTDENKCSEIDKSCRNAEIGCVQCKQILADNINSALKGIRERYIELKKDKLREVRSFLSESAEKCHETAAETISEVKTAMGTDYDF
ncbi:MAG: tryptophan--tRNA ligase [Fibrobacterota bacterium]